jgi:hypothetical protein
LANELAVGDQARVQTSLPIPLNPLVDLNWKTHDEVLEMRFKALARYAALLHGTYTPDPDIFDSLRDKRPWWGLAGQAVFGSGDQSILGLSEQSRFLLNPLMLVGVASGTNLIWRAESFTEADINNPNFPYCWLPDRLEFDAKHARAMVSYNVSSYLQRINDSGKLKGQITTPDFSLVAYNARDFGYSFIYADLRASQNILNPYDEHRPVRIEQFIHCGGSCGYPGGCNNMSPYIGAIEHLTYSKLPARVVVSLWKELPSQTKPADFTVFIDLR